VGWRFGSLPHKVPWLRSLTSWQGLRTCAFGPAFSTLAKRFPALKAAGLSGTEWLALFRANIAVESAFNPDARSSVGAIGLGQLMPGTADLLGVDPHDPEDNLHGSARYLLAQLEDFGAADLALAAYNAGPEAVRDYGGILPYAETEGHVAKVLRLTNATLSSE